VKPEMMDRKEFTNNLLLYGADIHQWPEEVRKAGFAALEASAEIKDLCKEHEYFEKVLRARGYEEPSHDLAERIIASSERHQQYPVGLVSFLSALLNDLHFPRQALSTLSVLILLILMVGFAIGFLTPFESSVTDAQEATNLQSFLYEEGDLI
jgi:hypothetical protein